MQRVAMARETDQITLICTSCGERYGVQIVWANSAAEFNCACGARLKPNMHDLFLIRHDMTDRAEIALLPFQ